MMTLTLVKGPTLEYEILTRDGKSLYITWNGQWLVPPTPDILFARLVLLFGKKKEEAER